MLALANPGLEDIIINSQNGYVNGYLRNNNPFSGVQGEYVDYLLNGIKNIPPMSIPDLILDVEDNVSKSGLSADEQCPLLLATMVGYTAYNYWDNFATTPSGGGGAWPAPPLAANYINWQGLPYWVGSAMEGVLLGYVFANALMPFAPTGNKIYAMVAASAGVNGAMVNFSWIPRIQNK